MCRSSQIIFTLIVTLLLSACGGGGGGSSASTPTSSYTPISYIGLVDPVKINNTNTASVVTTIIGDDSSSKVVLPTGYTKGYESTLDKLKTTHYTILENALGSKLHSKHNVSTSAFVNVDESYSCVSGSQRVYGRLDNTTLIGTLNYQYDECKFGSETWNGLVELEIFDVDVVGSNILDSTTNYTYLHIYGNGTDLEISGSYHLEIDEVNRKNKEILNLTISDLLRNRQTKTENYSIETQSYRYSYPYHMSVAIDGGFYDSHYGYMQVNTPSPLHYLANHNYPLTGGPLIITGANNASIEITPILYEKMALSLDLDGDKLYEKTHYLWWSNLYNSVGMDLGDSDGDGMHNGWESAYGLDPNNPSDAEVDTDGDGTTNLQEYLARKNPNDSASYPRNVDMMVTMSTTNSTAIAPYIEYKIEVKNNGWTLADNIIIEDTPPDGMRFVSATSNKARCVVSSSLFCSASDLYPQQSFTIWVMAKYEGTGIVDNQIQVSAEVIDSDLSNNQASYAIEVYPDDYLVSSLTIDYTLPSWTMFQGNASHTGYVPVTLDSDEFALRWQKNLFQGSRLHPIIAHDGKVFVGSDNFSGAQSIAALNASNGGFLWVKNDQLVKEIYQPSYKDGKIYYQTNEQINSYLNGVDAATGQQLFRTKVDNIYDEYHAPTPYGTNIYMAGGSYGGVYSYESVDGKEAWSNRLQNMEYWTPAVDDRYVYTYPGVSSKGLNVIDRVTGEVEYFINDSLSSYYSVYAPGNTPVLGANNAYVTQGGRLVSFDLQARDISWQLDDEYSGQVTLANNKVYVVNDTEIYVHDGDNGNFLWSWTPDLSDRIYGQLIVTDNLIFVCNSTKTYAIDLNTHNTVWTFNASGHLSMSNDGSLYIAGADGIVTSIKLF